MQMLVVEVHQKSDALDIHMFWTGTVHNSITNVYVRSHGAYQGDIIRYDAQVD
jgi:hypothetical protein